MKEIRQTKEIRLKKERRLTKEISIRASGDVLESPDAEKPRGGTVFVVVSNALSSRKDMQRGWAGWAWGRWVS